VASGLGSSIEEQGVSDSQIIAPSLGRLPFRDRRARRLIDPCGRNDSRTQMIVAAIHSA
jgi:hypothetical protein